MIGRVFPSDRMNNVGLRGQRSNGMFLNRTRTATNTVGTAFGGEGIRVVRNKSEQIRVRVLCKYAGIVDCTQSDLIHVFSRLLSYNRRLRTRVRIFP